MSNMKIKLVAIAKDEGAYISEWIFHHLYFGFDEIEIYVNYTTDNTYVVLEKIQTNFPVKYKNAEYLVAPEHTQCDSILSKGYLNHNPLQSRAYAESFFNAKRDGFTHVMFLDVDEFWVPTCFSKNIKEMLVYLDDPCSVSFIWRNRVDDLEEFDRPFKPELRYQFSGMFKTIIKVGGSISIGSSHHSSCRENHQHKRIKQEHNVDAFILHRFQRSKMEYVSLLGRGDPTFAGKFGLKFTRRGYFPIENASLFTFDAECLKKYDDNYQDFLSVNDLEGDIQTARQFVLNRATHVMDYIRENVKTSKLVRKVTTGLTLDDDITGDMEVRALKNAEINVLRNMAVELEKANDISKAYELMKIVYAFRPNRPAIERKYRQYARALGKNEDVFD